MKQNIIEFAQNDAAVKLEIMRVKRKQYGDNFKQFGKVAQALFPNGIKLHTEADWNRFGIVVQMLSKLTRYSENFKNGGHEDSLNDLGNYTTILQYLDRNK